MPSGSQYSSSPPEITISNFLPHQLVVPVFELPINGMIQDGDTKEYMLDNSIRGKFKRWQRVF